MTSRFESTSAEAMADLREPGPDRVPRHPVPVRRNRIARAFADVAWRIGHGRPARLAGRLVVAAALAVLAEAATGWQPASIAVMTGALTWLVLTGRADLASRQVAPPPPASRSDRPGTAARSRPSRSQ
jgi:hypothetical protein